MPAPEMSGPLAERYCDMLDMLEEIDLEAVERRIERLTKLRDALRRLRDTAPTETILEPVPLDLRRTPNRTRRTYEHWERVFSDALATGPKSTGELHALTRGELQLHSVYQYLARASRTYTRVFGSEPLQWKLAEAQKEVS
jgi:hypothetical protein